MVGILIVSSRKQFADTLTSILEKTEDVTIATAESGSRGLSLIAEGNAQLVIADENLTDMTGLAFIEKMTAVNPMINCAAATSLSDDEFHEASEGMGVLMGLPLEPEAEHVETLLKNFQAIMKLMSGGR